MKNHTCYLVPGGFYHIYNRVIGDEAMFKSRGNYQFFLAKYISYIRPIANTMAFCLMPNHFHFLIQVRSESEISLNLGKEWISSQQQLISRVRFDYELGRLLSMQFSHLFNGYAQAFNKQYERKGSLFIRNYKRIRVDNDFYLRDLVVYIHLNPVKGALTETPDSWQFSSYQSIINRNNTVVNSEMTLDFFDDVNNFIFVHQMALQGL